MNLARGKLSSVRCDILRLRNLPPLSLFSSNLASASAHQLVIPDDTNATELNSHSTGATNSKTVSGKRVDSLVSKLSLPALKPNLIINTKDTPKARLEKILNNLIKTVKQSFTTQSINPSTLDEIFSLISQPESEVSSDQALFTIRLLGSAKYLCTKSKKAELTQNAFTILKETCDFPFQVSHYNALYQTYIDNGVPFHPTSLLSDLNEKNILPNRVTYGICIARFCKLGDMKSASTILNHLVSQNMDISQHVYHWMIYGHCLTGDVNLANETMKTMDGAGHNINGFSHVNYVTGLMDSSNFTYQTVLDYLKENESFFTEDELSRVMAAYCDSSLAPPNLKLEDKDPIIAYIVEKIQQCESEYANFGSLVNLTTNLVYSNQYGLAIEMLKLLRPSPSTDKHGRFRYGSHIIHAMIISQQRKNAEPSAGEDDAYMYGKDELIEAINQLTCWTGLPFIAHLCLSNNRTVLAKGLASHFTNKMEGGVEKEPFPLSIFRQHFSRAHSMTFDDTVNRLIDMYSLECHDAFFVFVSKVVMPNILKFGSDEVNVMDLFRYFYQTFQQRCPESQLSYSSFLGMAQLSLLQISCTPELLVQHPLTTMTSSRRKSINEYYFGDACRFNYISYRLALSNFSRSHFGLAFANCESRTGTEKVRCAVQFLFKQLVHHRVNHTSNSPPTTLFYNTIVASLDKYKEEQGQQKQDFSSDNDLNDHESEAQTHVESKNSQTIYTNRVLRDLHALLDEMIEMSIPISASDKDKIFQYLKSNDALTVDECVALEDKLSELVKFDDKFDEIWNPMKTQEVFEKFRQQSLTTFRTPFLKSLTLKPNSAETDGHESLSGARRNYNLDQRKLNSVTKKIIDNDVQGAVNNFFKLISGSDSSLGEEGDSKNDDKRLSGKLVGDYLMSIQKMTRTSNFKQFVEFTKAVLEEVIQSNSGVSVEESSSNSHPNVSLNLMQGLVQDIVFFISRQNNNSELSAEKLDAVKDLFESSVIFRTAIDTESKLQVDMFPMRNELVALFASAFSSKNVEKEGDAIVQSVTALKDTILDKSLLQKSDTTFICFDVYKMISEEDFEGAVGKYCSEVMESESGPQSPVLLMVSLIQNEKTELLQNVFDVLKKVNSDHRAIYNLAIAYLIAGKDRQVLKLLATPGLRFLRSQMNMMCDRLVKDPARLEKFVSVAKNIFNSDKTFLYQKLLYAYKGNEEKLQEVRELMEEENVLSSPTMNNANMVRRRRN